MLNTLKLAKKFIRKVKKSKEYRFLSGIFMAKVILLILAVMAVSYLAVNATQAEAAYGINREIKQVKTANNATVYYLDHKRGLKKAYVSANAFLAYGNKWSDIKVMSATELNKWPAVRLVKSDQSPAVYYLSGNQKALIKSEQQFVDAGFKWPDVITIAQADLAQYRATDFKVAGAPGDYSGSQLLIALDVLSPAADYLPVNTQDNLLAVFNLKADGQPVEIKKLALNLKGVFSPEIIKEIYLTNESDFSYPAAASFSNRQAVFNFNDQPLAVAPGQARKIKVYVNLNNTSADILNHTIQVSISQAANLDGAMARGDFPVDGAIFTLAPGGDFLGQATVSEQTLGVSLNEAIIGTTEKYTGKFKLTEASGKADIFIKELKFANRGSAGIMGLNNFKLKNQNGQIVSTVAARAEDGRLSFKLDNYKIKKGGNEIFTILADVVGEENKTINFYLDRAKIKSSQGNFNLPANITNLDEIITIRRKAVGVMAKDLKGNNNVFSQQAGVIIGVFEIRNNNQKIRLERLIFSLEKSPAVPNLAETVYLVNYNSGEVYGYFAGDKFSAGQVSVNLNNLSLIAKQNLTVALVATIADSAKNGDVYKVILNQLDYRSDSGVRFTDAVSIAGAKLTLSKSNLYLYPNNDLGEQTFIKGEKNIKIASFIIEGAAGGDTKITGLAISRSSGSSGLIAFDNGFSNLKVYIGSSRIRTVKNPYSGDLAVDGFKYVLKSGTRAEVKIYADTEIDLQASEVQLAISNLTAVNNNSAIPAVINNLNTSSHKTTFGQNQAEISKVADGFITKGEDDNVIAGFKVKNTGAEDLKLQSITVNAADQELTYSLGYSNLKVIDRDQQRTAGYTVSRPVAGANKINLGGYLVKASQEIIFDVHVKTGNVIADGNIDIYFSDFSAQGKTSKVSALISGDPTDNYTFVIASANSDNSSNGNTVKFIKPVNGSITYGWYDPSYPYREATGEHAGVDIVVAQGTPVKAAAAGTVMAVVDNGSGDQASSLTIKHSETLTTRYVHLSRLDVKVGDQVKQGDIIGLSGGTPGTIGAGAYTNGAHLHFEVLLNGAAVDPEKYLP